MPSPSPSSRGRSRARGGLAFLLVALLAAGGLTLPAAAHAESGDTDSEHALEVGSPAGAVIVAQPQPVTVESGLPLELSVAAEGASSYRWQRATEIRAERPDDPDAWQDLDPQTTPSAGEARLSLGNATTEHAGTYRVVLLGVDGAEVISEPAEVVVTAPADPTPPVPTTPAPATPAPATPAPSVTAPADGTSNADEAPVVGRDPAVDDGSGAAGTPTEPAGTPDVTQLLRLLAPSPTPFLSGSGLDTARVTGGRSPGFEDVPDFPIERTVAVWRNDWTLPEFTDPEKDVLYGGDQLLIGGGGVTSELRPGVADDMAEAPYLAYRWGGEGEWTYNWDMIRGPEDWNQELWVEAPASDGPRTLRLEVIAVYRAVADLPEEVLHYWSKEYRLDALPAPEAAVLVQGPQDVTVRVGQPATFTLKYTGVPKPSMADVSVQTQEMKLLLVPRYAIPQGLLGEEFGNVGAGEVAVSLSEGYYEYTIERVTPEMDGMVLDFSMYGFDPRGIGYHSSVGTATLHVTDYDQPADWVMPLVTLQPQSLAQAPDANGVVETVLDSAAVGAPTPGVQWQRRLPGDTWRDLEDTNTFRSKNHDLWLFGADAVTQAQSGVQFRAVWTNRLGTAYSDPATILVRGELPVGWRWGDSDPQTQYLIPQGAEVGTSMTLAGKAWRNTSEKNTGSLVTVRIDGFESAQNVLHPITKEVIADKSVIAVAKANASGYWTVTVPLPEAWRVGDRYRVTVGSGELADGDVVRSESAEVEVWAPPELATITRDLPETVEVHPEDGATVTVEGAAPTPIGYRWEWREPSSADWTPIPEYYWQVAGDTVTIDPGSAFLEGTQLRAVLTTAKGEVRSRAATVRYLSTADASLDYDSDDSYAYGEKIAVTGTGLEPMSEYMLTFSGQPCIPDAFAVETDEHGRFSALCTVPAAAGLDDVYHIVRPGRYRVVAYDGGGSTAVGAEVTVAADPSVTAPTVVRDLDPVTTVHEGEQVELAPQYSGDGLGFVGQAITSGWFEGTPFVVDGDLSVDGRKAWQIAWNAGGAVMVSTEIDVIPADGSPHDYEFVTGASEEDAAVVWVEKNVEPGGTARITGRGWTKADGQSGSLIALKLNYKLIDDETGQYERTGDGILSHPLSGSPDSTIWAIVQAQADGSFQTEIDLPGTLTPGQRLSVAASSGVFATGDVQRMLITPSLVVGGIVYDEPPVETVACVPSTPSPTWEVQEHAEIGGTLAVSGKGWCHPRSGGSTIALKIDDGAYSHLDDSVHSNRTVWAIAQADDETGDWSIEFPLPDGTTSGPNGSTPAFPEGAHWIRLLTGSLKEYDAIRTIGTPGGQNTSFVVGEYRPNGIPAPLEATEELTDATMNGLGVEQSSTAITVTVPGAAEGDWVFLSAYTADGSPRWPWGATWFQADANGRVAAPLAGVTLPVGTLKLVAQSGNQGHAGELLGWGTLTVAAPPVAPETPVVPVPQTPAQPNPPAVSVAPRIAAAPAPATVPAAPFETDAGLTTKNAGTVQGVQEGTVVTLTLPDSAPGSWVYLYAYSKPIPVGWIQVDANRQVRVDITGLPAGAHKLAVLDATGALIGWTSASITAAESTAPAAAAEEEEATAAALAAPVPARPVGGLSADDWLLLGGGAGFLALVLAAGLVANRRRKAAVTEGSVA